MLKDQLKQELNDNPIQTIGVLALAVTATAKIIDALSAAKGRRAYAKSVDYRITHRR